jgi:hypothetical protein
VRSEPGGGRSPAPDRRPRSGKQTRSSCALAPTRRRRNSPSCSVR